MTQPSEDVPPFLHPSVLENLLLELDEDEGVWKIFIRNYIDLLPTRIEKIRMALTMGDLPGVTDAVLSLKTSSEMIGAVRLANLAELLQQALPLESGTEDPAIVLPQLAAGHYQCLKFCALYTAYLLKNDLKPSRRYRREEGP